MVYATLEINERGVSRIETEVNSDSEQAQVEAFLVRIAPAVGDFHQAITEITQAHKSPSEVRGWARSHHPLI